MDSRTAEAFVTALREPGREWSDRQWKDRRHIATTTWRLNAIRRLNRDSQLGSVSGAQEYVPIALVEIFLTEDLPEIDTFAGIFEVNETGIWYYDGDGSVDDPIWRQRVIPWRYVKGIVLHQAS